MYPCRGFYGLLSGKSETHKGTILPLFWMSFCAMIQGLENDRKDHFAMSRQQYFEELRTKYPVFEYKAFHLKEEDASLKITYDFEIPGLAEFHPSWSFPVKEEDTGKIESSEVIKRLAFQLGMVELVSYWKTACPKKVIVKAGSLSSWQADWWKKLYFNGLGEFFFVNGIETEYSTFMEICADGEAAEPFVLNEEEYQGCLVPIGGGKDSVVSLEVLSKLPQMEITTFSVNRIEAVKKVIDLCGEKAGDVLVKRTLDANMLELNKEGYLNGHTPFSAIVAFSSFLTAVLHGKRYITLSNENSANESTVRGSKVNHQYSKSYEFEQDFEEYIKTVVTSPIHYFSLLRPLSEIQIAKIFAECKRYHAVFRSCNAGSKKGIWCCSCPKCLFVYIILSPFMKEDELVGIFGENLLEKESLLTYFRELTGIDENKPFECVGTRSEVLSSLLDLIQRREKEGKKLPLLVEPFKDYIKENAAELKVLLSDWCDEHSVPEIFLGTIRGLLKRQDGWT